jgi:hypothetical protein
MSEHQTEQDEAPQGGEHFGEAPIGEEDAQGGGPPTSDTPGADAGGKAHTGLDEPHPAGDGPRTDRDVGGPTPDDTQP